MEDTYGNLISSLAMENDKRIVLLVMDGVGDCDNGGAGTALQQAATPNLDALADRSALGLHVPVATGVTPGSGPGHLALFGYDPLIYKVGRGVLSALGIEFPLTERDVAARLNFCTLDAAGQVADRRAGRISDEENRRVLARIREGLRPPQDVEVLLETVAERCSCSAPTSWTTTSATPIRRPSACLPSRPIARPTTSPRQPESSRRSSGRCKRSSPRSRRPT